MAMRHFALLVAQAMLAPAAALVWMPSHFGNSMVLQTWNNYHLSARLYGTAAPGEVVNATASVAAWPWMSAVTDPNGSWALTYNLPPGSGTAGFTLTIHGSMSSGPIVFTNVTWGDVFACVGDSSMLLPTAAAVNGSEWLASSEVQKWLSTGFIKLFAAGAASATTPQPNFNSSAPCAWEGFTIPCNTWVVATPQIAANFSSLCLQTIAQLWLADGHPGNANIGLVQLATESLPVETIMPSTADTSGCPPLPTRSLPAGAAGYYNGMLAPLSFQTVRAFILSQAGSDVGLVQSPSYTPGALGCHYAATVNAIRGAGQSGDCPLIFPLLAPTGDPSINGSTTLALQLEQLALLPARGGAVDTAIAAVAADAGVASLAPGNAPAAPWTPTNTFATASRLASTLAALGWWQFQASDVGPTAVTASFHGNTSATVTFTFTNYNSTLNATRLALRPAVNCSLCCKSPSSAFQVAASSAGPWVDATAALAADGASAVFTPLSSSGQLDVITAVQYGAAPPANPECFLVDGLTGLLATPFRMVSPSDQVRMEVSGARDHPTHGGPSHPSASRLRGAGLGSASVPSDSHIPLHSMHLIQVDGTFDRHAYLLHGRLRTRSAAAVLAQGKPIAPHDTPAATPPMGWNSWQAYRCNLDERLVGGVGASMVASGLAAAGYNIVGMDDCVMANPRLPNGSLAEDPARFPSTLFSLADGLAALNLGFGIYTSQTASTCVGRPGSYQHEAIDAQRWCQWGAATSRQLVKVDNCGGARWPALNTSWINIRAGLDKYCGGRPIILSVETCGSPAPTACGGWIRDSGATMWRTTDDLQLYWTSVLSNLDGNENMAPIAGPGYYNDPDMLIIGKPALSYPEAQSHLFGWAISAAPLLLSFDVTSAAARTDEVMTLLTAPEVLAVDQDPAVVQGVRVTPHNATGTECWARPLVSSSGNDTAVLYLNRGNAPADLTCQWELVAPGVLGNNSAAVVRDLFQRVDLGTFTGNYTARGIPAHGSVFIKLTPV